MRPGPCGRDERDPGRASSVEEMRGVQEQPGDHDRGAEKYTRGSALRRGSIESSGDSMGIRLPGTDITGWAGTSTLTSLIRAIGRDCGIAVSSRMGRRKEVETEIESTPTFWPMRLDGPRPGRPRAFGAR